MSISVGPTHILHAELHMCSRMSVEYLPCHSPPGVGNAHFGENQPFLKKSYSHLKGLKFWHYFLKSEESRCLEMSRLVCFEIEFGWLTGSA